MPSSFPTRAGRQFHKDMIRAAIIIPHLNDSVRLRRCLETLSPQLTDEVELVVVDNGSSEDLNGLRQDFLQMRLVTEDRRGAAAARNRGVAETAAPLLFFLDCDVVPAPDWLTTAFACAGSADLVGGRVDVFDETPPPRTGAQAFEAVFAFDNRTYVERKGFSVTANLLTRRDVFDAVGGFRGGLSEDADWCFRACAEGYRLVYADALRVAHPSRGDMPALLRKWRRLVDEAFQLNGTDPMGRIRWAAKALLMPVSVLAHTPRVLRHSALTTGQERYRAWTTLARLRLRRMTWMLGQALRKA